MATSKGNYDLYPLQKKIWQQRIEHNIDLRRCWLRNQDETQTVIDEINQRLHEKERKNWVVIQITGETGEFKSSVGLSITLHLIDNTFTTARISMQYQEFLDSLATSKPKQAYMLDEQVFQHGLGSARIIGNMQNIIETLRQRQNSLVVITPREKSISEDQTTFTLEPCGYDEDTHTVRLLIKKRQYIGFYYQTLDWDSQLWKKYQKLKEAFLEKTKNQEYMKIDYDEKAKNIHATMPAEYKTKKRRIKLWVEKHAGNITKEERDLLIEQVSMLIETDG